MESKVSVPSSGPSVCYLSIDAIEAADGSNGVTATAVISLSEGDRVDLICHGSELDQSNNF